MNKDKNQHFEILKRRYRKKEGRIFAFSILILFLISLLGFARFDGRNFAAYLTIAIQAVFIAYLLRHMAFAYTGLQMKWDREEFSDYEPPISILIPARNEEKVIRGLIESLAEVDYPREKFQVIAVDDASDDKTGEILDELARKYDWLIVIHRSKKDHDLAPGKSSVLNDALRFASGEIIFVYDADHQVKKDTIKKIVRHFKDPKVGMAMGRCVVRNADKNILTKLIYIEFLSGYKVNQYGRELLHGLAAYGGSNCAIRRSLLEELGGFNISSVTEDTDLTVRGVLEGYRVVYDDDAVSTELAVTNLTRYWKQRYRWAYGHQHVFYDYWLDVVRCKHLGILDKIEFLMFLFIYHMPVVMFLGLLLTFMWAFGIFLPRDPFIGLTLWIVLLLGPLLELAAGLVLAREKGKMAFYLILFLPLFFLSIMICTKAFLDGIIRGITKERYVWVKTEREI
ncbi:MAG: glycosyltransferase [Candidatus Hadarchaeales archaeon]